MDRDGSAELLLGANVGSHSPSGSSALRVIESAHGQFLAAMGDGRMGSRSWDRSRFSISISSTRMLGDTAETGTQQDSAPQLPLNTAASSPVARIFEKHESGVPTIS